MADTYGVALQEHRTVLGESFLGGHIAHIAMNGVDFLARECFQDGDIRQVTGVDDGVAVVEGVGNALDKIIVTGK